MSVPSSCCGPLRDATEPVERRALYWYVLSAFPRLHRAPTLEEMQRDLLIRHEDVVHHLKSLERKGALRLDSTTLGILDAYPYSGVPTAHRVRLDEDGEVHAMCAVDAFYIPFLTGCNVTIRSRCFFCRREITVRVILDSVPTADPPESVIWNSAAPYDCPQTNFFCGEEHLRRWREREPEEPGELYSLPDALDAGRRAADGMRKSSEGL